MRTAYQEGCAQQANGQHEAAAKSFSAAIDAAPDFADAVQNLGCCLFALRRFAEAATACAKLVALRPKEAGAHFNLGMALLSDERAAEAIEPLRAATQFDDTEVKHHRALGQALIEADRKPEAVAALIKASTLNPTDAALLVTLSGLLIDQGELDAAVGAALLAIQHQPANAFAQGNLARALQGLGKPQQALAPARAAARLAPLNGGAAATLGAVLYTLGHYPESLERSRRASMLAPGLYQAKMNAGLALEALGQFQEAEIASRAALRLAPDAADVKHNLAAMLLASGRMDPESWALYDARLRMTPSARKLDALPRWQGEDIAGKTLLIHCEQGFGDTIQFLRYAKMAKARCARVILVVQTVLVRLLQGLPAVDEVVGSDAPTPAYDIFCPLLSLPRAFGTTLDTIPSGAPYIHPPADLIERRAMPPVPGLKVGLVWAGSPIFVHDAIRSIPLDAFAPLADLPGIQFHSLQKPPQPTGSFPMVDRMAATQDFADTAALIAGLDLVISVDSAVAHLAAAMGKEVWLLSRFIGCWRWLRNREDSPWYPTMRIFRQTEPNDWTAVIERVREALALRTGLPAMPRVEPIPVAISMPKRPSALDGLVLPDDAPRTVVALIGTNENGILRSVAHDFMSLLPPHGLQAHCVDMTDPSWLNRLGGLLDDGVLFAWGPAGVGARLPHPDGLLWDAMRVPFISVLADSPAWMPANHCVKSHYVANGYMYRDWLTMQRKLIRSPQLSSLLPHGVPENPFRDRTAWSRRQHRMVFVKTGCDPAQHRAEWSLLPPRFRAIVEDASAAALKQGVGDISGVVLDCMDQHGLDVERRPAILFALMREVDVYVRDMRSTAMVQAILDLPVDIIGRGWDHLAAGACRARFHPAVDAATLPDLYADTQFLLNTMPNFSSGVHERVPNGFAAKSCVITNENADMRARFGTLPSYFGVDTEAAGLAEQMATFFHGTRLYDDCLEPAFDLVNTEFTAEGYMRGLVDLALEIRAATAFSPFDF